MAMRRTRREQILSDFSVGVRRSPRLSQRYSQPPELTSSHPLVESRRSLRSTASVGPPSILNESGQSVPPSFYDNEPEDHMQTVTEDTLRSYTSQQGLPKHLYGLDNSDGSDDEGSKTETQRQSTPVSHPAPTTPIQTPRVYRSHAVGVCPRIVRLFTSMLFKCGSLLYLAGTTILCLDVILLHRLFHSGVSTKSLARYWILPLIMLALMLLLLRGGVSDNDWSEPLPEIHHMDETELRAFRKAIFREVAETVEREIGTFKATVKTDMEAHLNKRVREVLLDSEKRLEGTISTTIDGEAKMRQKALSQLRESIWNELNSSLEANLVKLQSIVENQIDTVTGKIDTEKLDWVTENTLTQATDSLKEELQQVVKRVADDLKQQMATVESELQQASATVNVNLLGVQQKQETAADDLSLLTKRVDVHDGQIAALQRKYHDILFEIIAFKSSYLMRLDKVEKSVNASVTLSTVKTLFDDELDKVLTNDSSSLRLWLDQLFASKEELEAVLEIVNDSGPGELTRKDVRQMIELSLAKYSADRIGKFDFALENSGGSVILDMCSKTYTPSLATVSLFGFPVWHVATTPKVIIQPQVYPGDCWAFEGSSGYATIKLKDMVQVTGITIEHIPRELTPNGSLESAPKDIQLMGFNTLEDEGEELGVYKYKLDGGVIQQFDIELQKTKAFQFVQFRFLTNYGHPEYTCVYRVRVHGQYT